MMMILKCYWSSSIISLFVLLIISFPTIESWMTSNNKKLTLTKHTTSAKSVINRVVMSSLNSVSTAEDEPTTNIISRRNFLFQSVAMATTTAVTSGTIMTGNPQVTNAYYIPPPMDGKVVLITGGNTGLGLESAKRLAAANAEVIVTARTEQKGEQAVQDILKYLKDNNINNNQKVIYKILDLCDLQQVQEFTKELNDDNIQIDVLMNNAGVMAIPNLQITKDGYERTFQTNHLGHFVLTAKLIPLLKENARIINVSSEAYQFVSNTGFDINNINGEKQYGPWSSYGLSKLENILFTQELQRRFDDKGLSYTAISLHPGAVATDLGRYLIGEETWNNMKSNGMTLQQKVIFTPLSYFTKTVEDGASTQIYAASVNNINAIKGQFLIDCKVKNLPSFATDINAAKQLWGMSEQLSGIKFEI